MKGEWPEELPKESRSAANDSVVKELAAKNPELVGAFLDRFAKGSERDSAISSFAFIVVKDDPRGAMEYVGSLNGPADYTLRQRMTAQILRAWGLVDHEAGLAWFQEPGQGREKGSQTLVNVVQSMFGADPKAADDFLLNLPEAEALVNQTYIDRVARRHFYHDGLEAATEWVRGFPNERSKMRAFHQIAEDLAARDPREAAEWMSRFLPEETVVTASGDEVSRSLTKEKLIEVGSSRDERVTGSSVIPRGLELDEGESVGKDPSRQ